MKKFLSGLLTIVMLISSFSNIVFAEDDETISLFDDTTSTATTTDTTEEVGLAKEVDLTESYDVTEKKDYSVTDIRVDKSELKVTIDYKVISNSVLNLKIINEDTATVIDTISQGINAEQKSIDIVPNLTEWPQYFYIEAVISDSTNSSALSEVGKYLEYTKDYEAFMTVSSNDAMFGDQVVLNYGLNEDGNENFAVIRNDVEVVYVDSMNDLEITNSNGNVVGDVALMSADEVVELYSFSGVDKGSKLESALSDVEVGENVIIVPKDDITNALALRVEDKSEVELLNEDASNVTLAADIDIELTEEDLFDFVRIDIVEEIDADDIVPAEGVVAEEDEEEVELFGFFWDGYEMPAKSYEKSKTYTLYNSNNCTVKDTIRLNGTVNFSVHFSSYKVKYQVFWTYVTVTHHYISNVKATVSVTVSNQLKLDIAKDKKVNIDYTVGNLYKKSFLKIVEVKVPLTISFEGKASAQVTTTLTQSAGGTFGIQYNGSRATPIISSNGFSSEYDFTVKGNISADLGIGIGVEAKATNKFKANVKGVAGITADGNCGNGKISGSTRHDCDFCIDGVINWYLKGNASVLLDGTVVASPSFGKRTGKIADFYASFDADRSPKWKCGKGDCSNKSYKVVVTTTNSKTKKALKDATVKYGSNTLGKSNSNGKVTGWLKPGTYNFKATKSNFNSASAKKKVGVSGLNLTLKLTPKGTANEEYYYLDHIYDLNDEEYAEFVADTDFVDNCLFLIRNVDDLNKLANLVNNTERDTSRLRFVMNNASGTIDMSGIDWTPIGTADRPFNSEFDGNKMTITGLTIDSDSDYVGLFGNVNGAEIFDLGITGASVKGNNNVGIVTGAASGLSKIYDTYVTGSVSGLNNVGAIVGSLDKGDVLNTYSHAGVSGASNVGGLVGIFNHTATTGQLANSYTVGDITGTSNVGGVVGSVTFENAAVTSETTDDTIEEMVEDVQTSGVQYCYCLNTSADKVVGTQGDGATVIAYSVTEEQATGIGSEEIISIESDLANTYTLVDALNAWYEVFGLNAATEESIDDPTNLEDVTTEDEDETTVTLQVPDPYNKWYEDEGLVNEGYPLFEEKGTVYLLTVDYVYQDGTEAKPSVTLYLEEGQSYDVDSYTIDGYYTEEIEYSGTMPAGDTFFKVVYRAVPTDISVTDLFAQYQADGTQAQSGSICNIYTIEDLIALEDYVATGGNTSGAIFNLKSDLDLTDVTLSPIGTSEKPFKGIFNSGGHSISNLNMVLESSDVGLFGYTKDAIINNPHFIDAYVVGVSNVGSLIGYAENTTVNNTNIVATVLGDTYTGGVIGYSKSSTLNGVYSSGNVYANSYVGGITGMLDSSTMVNCENHVVAESSVDYAGGMAGYMKNSSVINSYNIANICGEAYVGGITSKSENTLIENVYSSGTVEGTSNVASFVVDIDNKVSSCYYIAGTTPVVTGSSDGMYTITTSAGLLTILNNWVLNKAESKYYEWLEDEGFEYPVLGTSMTNWVTDFELTSSTLKLTYNTSVQSNGILYVATYDKDGKLVKCYSYTVSGAYTEPVTSNVIKAKAFIWDTNMMPLDVSMERTK